MSNILGYYLAKKKGFLQRKGIVLALDDSEEIKIVKAGSSPSYLEVGLSKEGEVKLSEGSAAFYTISAIRRSTIDSLLDRIDNYLGNSNPQSQ